MNKTEQVLDIFQQFRMAPTAIDQYEQTGRQVLVQRLTSIMGQGKVIDFVMLGFPFKSINVRDKVLGRLPDLGELLSFEQFKRFGQLVREVYQPGINLNLVSDGYVFNPLLQVSDNEVARYAEVNQDLSREAPVTWYYLDSFYNRNISLSQARIKLTEQFGISYEKMEEDILLRPNTNMLYKGMIRFMHEELALQPYDSGNQLHRAAKKLAREMMMANETYSNLVAHEFKDSIRLSMHPTINDGEKFSFQLINSPLARQSAWHAAIVVGKDGLVETIHKRDAEAAGYQLQYRYNQPYNYLKNI